MSEATGTNFRVMMCWVVWYVLISGTAGYSGDVSKRSHSSRQRHGHDIQHHHIAVVDGGGNVEEQDVGLQSEGHGDADSHEGNAFVRKIDGGLDFQKGNATVRAEVPQKAAKTGKSREVLTQQKSPMTPGSRGFIMCAGTRDDAVMASAVVKQLRWLGNSDPVRVFHVDEELDKATIALLENHPGVSVQDLLDLADHMDVEAAGGDMRKYRSYACKILALLHSPFQQTTLVDSDAMFFTNPAGLWDLPLIRQSGTLFFNDRMTKNFGQSDLSCQWIETFANSSEGQLLGATLRPDFREAHEDLCEKRTNHEQCASMVVVDQAHPVGAQVLAMLKKLLTSHILKDKAFKSSRFWGDKEFYWIACELAGQRCSFNPAGRPLSIFHFDDEELTSLRPSKVRNYVGCTVQAHPEQPQKLFYINLGKDCGDWGAHGLNAITDWNSGRTLIKDCWGQLSFPGSSFRTLSKTEHTAIDHFRNSVPAGNRKSPTSPGYRRGLTLHHIMFLAKGFVHCTLGAYGIPLPVAMIICGAFLLLLIMGLIKLMINAIKFKLSFSKRTAAY